MSDATLLRVANLTRNTDKRDDDDSDEDDGSSEEDSPMEDNAGKPDSSNADVQGDGSFAAAVMAGGASAGADVGSGATPKGSSPVDDYVHKRGKGLAAGGGQGTVKDKGLQNQLRQMHPEVRKAVLNGIRADQRQRLALAQRITANV